MSNFYCPECGAACYDSGPGIGYITGCEHYPADCQAVGFCSGCNEPLNMPIKYTHDKPKVYCAKCIEKLTFELRQPGLVG